MTKNDKRKSVLYGKTIKSINFDTFVLEKLERKAKIENTTVSKIVNTIIGRLVMNDVEFYRELSKVHYLEFQKYQFLKAQAEEAIILVADKKP